MVERRDRGTRGGRQGFSVGSLRPSLRRSSPALSEEGKGGAQKVPVKAAASPRPLPSSSGRRRTASSRKAGPCSPSSSTTRFASPLPSIPFLIPSPLHQQALPATSGRSPLLRLRTHSLFAIRDTEEPRDRRTIGAFPASFRGDRAPYCIGDERRGGRSRTLRSRERRGLRRHRLRWLP